MKEILRRVIADVLASSEQPMTSQEVMDEIAKRGLYDFNAKDPTAVVRNTLSKHSVQNTHTCASKQKYFNQLPDRRYENLNSKDE